MDRRIIHSRGCKKLCGGGVVPDRSKIRSHINCVGGDCHGTGKIHLLPPRRSLIDKSGAGKKCPGGGPQVPNMSTCVRRALVEANSTDISVVVSEEFHP